MSLKKALIVKFKGLRVLEEELLSLSKKRNGYIQPETVIQFESIDGFRNFMTLQKLELLTLIASKKPKSVYTLAKMVGRSIAPVQKDCYALAKARFIVFEKETGGRGTMTPKLKFDYDRIIVEMPEYPYQLSFKATA